MRVSQIMTHCLPNVQSNYSFTLRKTDPFLVTIQVHDVSPEGPVPATLVAGHVVTCEPGIYFVPGLLEPAYADPRMRQFLNKDAIDTFMHVGGVRIEDNVAVTASGYENLTTCPKTVKEIEEIMRRW